LANNLNKLSVSSLLN